MPGRRGALLAGLVALPLLMIGTCYLRPTAPLRVRTVPLPGTPLAVALDARTRRAFVALYFGALGGPGTGGVATVDLRSGAVLRLVRQPHYALQIVVDTRTNRVFAPGFGMLDAISGAF